MGTTTAMGKSVTEELAALKADHCPLCGQPNACAVSACGRFDVDCWCTQITFAPEALERIPPELKNKACLCSRCAQGQSAEGVSAKGPRVPSTSAKG